MYIRVRKWKETVIRTFSKTIPLPGCEKKLVISTHIHHKKIISAIRTKKPYKKNHTQQKVWRDYDE